MFENNLTFLHVLSLYRVRLSRSKSTFQRSTKIRCDTLYILRRNRPVTKFKVTDRFSGVFPACPTAYLARPSLENVTINRFDLNFGFIAGDRLSRQHCVDVEVFRVIPVILQDLEAFRRSLFTRCFPANILISASRLLLIRT